MRAAVRREKYLAIALAFAALLLAGLLFWEWERGLALERDLLKLRNVPATPAKAQKILPEFNLPAADSGFPELIPRSIFSTSRRSSAPATKGGARAMKKGQFVLVGVLITPRQKSALLRDVQTNKTEVMASSAVVRGMTLGEVEPSRVVLHQGAESEELVLNVQTGPKNAALPRPSGPPPPAAPAVAQSASSPASAATAASAPSSAPVRGASSPASPASAPGGPSKSAPQVPPSVPQADPKKSQ